MRLWRYPVGINIKVPATTMKQGNDLLLKPEGKPNENSAFKLPWWERIVGV